MRRIREWFSKIRRPVSFLLSTSFSLYMWLSSYHILQFLKTVFKLSNNFWRFLRTCLISACKFNLSDQYRKRKCHYFEKQAYREVDKRRNSSKKSSKLFRNFLIKDNKTKRKIIFKINPNSKTSLEPVKKNQSIRSILAGKQISKRSSETQRSYFSPHPPSEGLEIIATIRAFAAVDGSHIKRIKQPE